MCTPFCLQGDEKNWGKTKGLSLFSATLFIAGEMAGSGVLALPRAVVNTGVKNNVNFSLFNALKFLLHVTEID